MIDLSSGKEIYERVDALREKKGFSWYEVSKRAGLSRSVFNQWRDAYATPTLASLTYVCEALNIGFLDFIVDKGEIIPLTEEQQELIKRWNLLDESQQLALLNFLIRLHPEVD